LNNPLFYRVVACGVAVDPIMGGHLIHRCPEVAPMLEHPQVDHAKPLAATVAITVILLDLERRRGVVMAGTFAIPALLIMAGIHFPE
jgi:hypothetical protein